MQSITNEFSHYSLYLYTYLFILTLTLQYNHYPILTSNISAHSNIIIDSVLDYDTTNNQLLYSLYLYMYIFSSG